MSATRRFPEMSPFYFDKDESTGGGIPTRDQVAIDDTWNLAHLYPNAEAWSADFAALQGRYESVIQFRGRVGESARTLREVMEFDKSLSPDVQRRVLRRSQST